MNLSASNNAATLPEVLRARAEDAPDVRWLTLLAADGSERHLTYGGLLEQSQTVAGALRELGVSRGDRVIIILPTSVDFFLVFWAALLCGAVPVPLYPPFRPNEMDRYGAQLAAIVDNCGASVAVTTGTIHRILKWLVKPLAPTVTIVTADRLHENGRPAVDFEKSEEGETALIQYTSGSTGSPKGAELTHRNLLSNIRAVSSALDFRPDDVGVSWLPLYHDMGLIGAVLGTLHYSIPLVLISPQDFIRSPKVWLRTMARFRGTLSAAPNFAYSLCTRKIRDHDLKGVDLSHWRVAINGAEQIHPSTIEQFAQRFKSCGFSKKAFMPAYGLAESTLAVTFAELETGPAIGTYRRKEFESEGRAVPAEKSDPDGMQWVSVGRTIPGHAVRIVGPDRRDVPDRTVGEVAIQGPSVMKGYYRKPEVTAEVLREGWLYSGDLGFRDGESLFITGRSKDVIIKGGRNYYPHDIEASAAGVEGVRPGCLAAFGVPQIEQGTEQVVLLVETAVRSAGRRRTIAHEIRKRVQRDTGCGPDHILLVPPGSVPKTSSGKIQRYLCRERFLAGDLMEGGRPWWLVWIGIAFRRAFTKNPRKDNPLA